MAACLTLNAERNGLALSSLIWEKALIKLSKTSIDEIDGVHPAPSRSWMSHHGFKNTVHDTKRRIVQRNSTLEERILTSPSTEHSASQAVQHSPRDSVILRDSLITKI